MKIEIAKYQYIDIIRGIAVLGVVAVHSSQEIIGLNEYVRWIFNYGQLGVQLFFIASALTLCLSMNSRKETSVSNFYIRRLFRIAPLYYFGIVLNLILSLIKSYYKSGKVIIPHQYTFAGVLSNVMLVHGFNPWANNNIVPGGWSIGTEMLFYVMFPFLYTIQLEMSNKKYILYALHVVFLCFISEFAVFYFFNKNTDNVPFIYFSIVNQLSVFLIGIYLYRIIIKKTETNIAYLLMGGGGGIILSCLLLNDQLFKSGFNGFMIPILSGISFLLLCHKLSSLKLKNNLTNKMIVKIGEMSFSIYILHFFVKDTLVYIYNKIIFNSIYNSEYKLLLLYVSVVAISYLLSVISNHLIEKPGIQLGKKMINNLGHKRLTEIDSV